MAEIFPVCRVFTVDRKDFSVYRRWGKKTIPCEFPAAGQFVTDNPNMEKSFRSAAWVSAFRVMP